MANNAIWETRQKDGVLAYFTDSVSVRVTPYSSIALIGIPYMHANDLRGAWAIPHEVGHLRFWSPFKASNAQISKVGLDPNLFDGLLMNVREVYYPFLSIPSEFMWSEELFADAYSVLVGGPLSAWTGMDSAMEHAASTFRNFSFEKPYPTPIIRPLLMIKALTSIVKAPSEGGIGLLHFGWLTPHW